ncbi:hypothetical protein L9F63_002757, partial [Diploptera punctata]
FYYSIHIDYHCTGRVLNTRLYYILYSICVSYFCLRIFRDNLIIMNCQFTIEHEDLSNTETGLQDVKVEIKSEVGEQTDYIDIKQETFPASAEAELKVTSDAVKNEFGSIYMKEEINKNL